MNPVLLDTHALIWLVSQSERLGVQSLRLAKKAQGNACLHVSAISFWEIAMLAQKATIKLKSSPAQWRTEVLRIGLQEAGVDGAIAIRATELMEFHQDPADRIIAATALELNATLVTADAALLGWRSKLKRQDAHR